MALDFPAAGSALWAITDATGIRPEFLLVVLYAESGFNPAVQNLSGAPYYGLNQISGSFLQAKGIDPSTYLTWPASQQLAQVVRPYMQGQVNAYGPLTSGIRVEQANFYPASLTYAPGLDDVIVAAPSSAYEANKGLDASGKGSITPRDLGAFLSRGVNSAAVRSAIASTYVLRPSETPEDPVYGASTSSTPSASPLPVIIAAAAAAGAVALANRISPGTVPLPRPLRRYLPT